jgi:hypothetical protein
MKKRHQQKLILLSISLVLLFNIPFVFVFNKWQTIVGIPKFYLGIFSIWFISVVISFIVLKRFDE